MKEEICEASEEEQLKTDEAENSVENEPAVQPAAEEIKEYMKAWMMFRREEGRIRLFPIIGKVSGYYPADYEEKSGNE